MKECLHCDNRQWEYAAQLGYSLCSFHYEVQYEFVKRKNKDDLVKALAKRAKGEI